MELLTPAQVRDLDRAAIDASGRTGFEVMSRAGQNVVDLIESSRQVDFAECVFTLFCGPGFTGALGAFAAKALVERQRVVQFFTCDGRHLIEDRYPKGLGNAFGAAVHGAIQTMSGGDDMAAMRAMNEGFGTHDVVIDAVFGRELCRPIEMYWREILGWTGRYAHGYALIALDLPSGYDADTGEFIDFTEDEIVANGYITNMSSDCYNLTISVLGDCPAYHRGTCSAYCGKVVPLGIEDF